MSRPDLLHVKHLSLQFGETSQPVVNDVSFSIARGEMVAVVGESGSGKSLTALSCLGLQPKEARMCGSISFDGQEISSSDEASLRQIRGKRVSMIFQEPMTALNPLHPIGKQIAEMIKLHQLLSDTQIEARTRELLEQVGLSKLSSRLNAYPHELSGGERQRVMIAMAIANTPDLLIADEPTTAVDVTVQAKILTLLKQLQKDIGMAMLFITHDLTLVRRLADRVVVMRHGQVIEHGLVKEVFTNPQHDYTQMLLESEPKGHAEPLASDSKPVMECDGLKVHFPIRSGLLRRVTDVVKAVDGISITIPEKSTLGIVGESGSGKTTLGFALLRLVHSQGRIVFMGDEIQHLKGDRLRALRKRMQMVFQDPYASLNPRMKVLDVIGEGLRVHQPEMGEDERTRMVMALLEEVGLLPEMAHRYPHEFSGGQRQRISIARAMVLKPAFIVMDEPTSALDLTVQSQIIDLLRTLQAKYGTSYIFISHDLRVVRAIAHQVAVMQAGKLVELAETQRLFESPKEAYTQQLIEAALLKSVS